jgi:hypothetical protein
MTPPLGSPVLDAPDAFMPGTMGTAVDLALGLDAVADHPAFAVSASRGHRVDSAFEAVERHRPVALGNAKRFVIVVTANITLSHGTLLSKPGDSGHNGLQLVGFHVAPSPITGRELDDL